MYMFLLISYETYFDTIYGPRKSYLTETTAGVNNNCLWSTSTAYFPANKKITFLLHEQ